MGLLEPLCKLHTEVETLLKTLAQNFMKQDYVKHTSGYHIDPCDQTQYVPIEHVYLGMTASETLVQIKSDCTRQQILIVYSTARDFYIEAIKQLKARFKFTDQIYSDIQAVDPTNAQRLNPVSLTDIARRYSQASWNINLRQLDKEWRSQALLQFQYDSTDVISYWKHVFYMRNNKGEPRYIELPKLKYFLCLPFFNAVVERLFSHVKNIKTDKRTCLDESTLAGLLHVKHGMKRNCETASTFRMNDEMKRCVKKVIASATSDEVKARKTGV